GKSLTAEVFGGWLRQDYRDARLPDLSTWDVGATLDWVGKGGLRGSLRVDRSIEETTLGGSSAYILTSGRFTLRSDVGPRLSAGIGISGSNYDYIGAARSEFVIGGDLWARYWLDRHFYVGASFIHGERSSTAAGYDYDQNRFLISMGAELRPHFALSAPRLAIGGAAPGGAYLGLLAGHGTLVTALDGPRGEGGNTADFGDHGAAAAAVAGYGFLAGSLYLGVEGEVGLSGPDWKHSSDRVFSIDRLHAAGISARLGWVTPFNDLIYGRVGLYSTEFHNRYAHSASYYSKADRLTGLATGLGIETRAGRRGFVRAEYVAIAYNDIDVPTGGGNVDNFATSETQFRFGGGIRFGAATPAADKRAPIAFGGPYVGVQIGHGALVTSNQGTRSEGTQLDVTRASRGGLLGLYTGYGAAIGRAYLGLEAEGDASAINWNIEREPTGRTYSAAHDWSFGGSARAGVLVADSALIYGRVGAIRTRFGIRYATDNVTVRSARTRTGVRYGGGLEIGIGGRARLRADYTVTDYAAYDLEYGRNVDHFDHTEALFRFGFTWRL
ncbi:MAG TPA: outer membrane beta-barrel protein, partial [Sphingomonas sp.]